MNKMYAFEKLIKIRKKNEHLKKLNTESKKVEKAKHNYQNAIKLSQEQKLINNPNERKFKELLIELGIKFIWQKPFSNYERYVCADFYIPEINTIIEIDGAHHKKDYDLERTIYLKRAHKISKVIRYSNAKVANDIYSIKNELINLLL